MSTLTIPAGWLLKADGSLIPEANVREQDKLRDQTANALGEAAVNLNLALTDFKKAALQDIADLVSISAEKYNVKLGGKKGNVSITSFDGKFQIKRVIAENIVFTEEIHAAKSLIDGCVKRWSEGANQNLCVAVENAFRTNKHGSLITTEILAMQRWEIDDKEWEKAMEALSDAILISGTTTYVNVYQRDEETGKYIAIPLSLSGV